MIFSRFFSPSHTSKNPQTRINAIAELSPQKASDKAILHELAFNDDNADVSLTALEKLHSFPLWQKMAQIAGNDKVRKIALQQVEQAVLGRSSLMLDSAQRKAYLLESASADLVTKALNEDDWLLEQEELTLSLLSRLAKPVWQSFFLRRASPSLQQKLINTLDDTALLLRLQKKSSASVIQQQIEQRLNTLNERKQKPIEIEKQATLTLSKLLALQEKSDYEEIAQRTSDLQADYTRLAEQFSYVDEDIRTTLENKYDRISAQIERHLLRLKPEWEARKKDAEAQNILENANRALQTTQTEVRKLFHKPLSEATTEEIKAVEDSVNQAEQYIELACNSASAEQLDDLHRRYQQLSGAMADISVQQNAAIRLQLLLDKVEALDLTSAQEMSRYVALASEWKQLAETIYKLPPEWQKRWNTLKEVVRTQQQQEKSEQAQQVKQCRRHINAINGLIENGKFRPAMSRFGKLQASYEGLNDRAKEALATRYQQVLAQIERLEGWQNYIAAPRKPVLLEEAKVLAETHPEDIRARADAIKYLRQQWNSLGSIEDELKPQFDNYLEQAFAPCREFYAQQERLREQAIEQREMLIGEAASLAEIADLPELARQAEKLKKQWRESQPIDSATYQKLKREWDKAIAGANDAISNWQQSNKQAKQALIEKARLLLELSDYELASEQAQQLQQQWKAVGPAGPRQESKLWHAFREINDAIFAKRKKLKRELHQESTKAADQLAQRLDNLQQTVLEQSAGDSESALEAIETELNTMDLSRGVAGRLNAQISETKQRLKARHFQSRLEKRRDQLEALLELLCVWRPGSENAQTAVEAELWERMGKNEQAALLVEAPPSRDRLWLTVTLEVVLNIPSPADSALRQNVQLALMTAKLERGEEADVDSIIAQWIQWGPVSEEQQSVFTRFTTCVYHYLDTLGNQRQ